MAFLCRFGRASLTADVACGAKLGFSCTFYHFILIKQAEATIYVLSTIKLRKR